MTRERSCVIVVENLPVPFDRRVWQEAQALTNAGWSVSVICPKTEKYPKSHETIDGIEIYRHWLPFEARGKFGFLFEYSAALFHELRLLTYIKWKHGFSVIQACNPPDLIFLVAAPFQLFGAKFVFDQHDVNPELFTVKFKRKGFLHKGLLFCEKMTYRAADLIITANRAFRDIAVGRGGQPADKIVTVYSIPAASRMHRVEADKTARGDRKTVLGYVGIIGDQDGVDHMVRTIDVLVKKRGVTDFRAIIVGDGPALASVRELAASLDLGDVVTFTGYLSGNDLLAQISDFDIGLIPDPVNESNDLMSMNKVFEYSALGIPIASYPLTETRNLLGDAAVFAQTAEPEGLADACLLLIDDLKLRADCAAKGSRLAAESFIWETEAKRYVAAFERLISQDGYHAQPVAQPSLKG